MGEIARSFLCDGDEMTMRISSVDAISSLVLIAWVLLDGRVRGDEGFGGGRTRRRDDATPCPYAEQDDRGTMPDFLRIWEDASRYSRKRLSF